MAKSKELEKPEVGVEVEEISDAEAALIEANRSEVDASEFVVPILKLAQPLTDEVTSGEARPGEFVLALTGETFVPPVQFIVAGKGKGRFKPGRGGTRTLVAYDTLTVPESWTDDPFIGQPFSEHPDAEEKWREKAQAGGEWGSGPPIQTTYNYTGFIRGTEVPVRLSLRRTSAPAAKKWNTILDAVLRGQYWGQVFEVGSELQRNDNGTYYTVTVKQAGKPTSEERAKALELAQVLRSQSVRTVDREEGPTRDPGSNGGLDV